MAAVRASGVLALAFAACSALPPGAECRARDGRVLRPPPLEPERRAQLERDLAAAEAVWAAAPDDRDAAIWVGRRLGYLGRHRDAVAVFTRALAARPDDPFLLRHRGHRWITLREFQRAIVDLQRAAVACRTVPDRVEPDGQPTPGRPPHGTLHYAVHYHLGLAQFLAGDFAAAERAWLDCLAVAAHDEARVAVSHWLWCARRRLGDVAGAAAVVAAIGADLDVVENRGYWQLCRFYAGRLARADLVPPAGSAGSALAFGLAHYDLVTGDRERAVAALRTLAGASGWSAFGVIAAEVELTR